MKFILQFPILFLFTIVIHSCKKDDNASAPSTISNYFKIGNVTYPLSNAAYSVDSIDGFTALVITSPGLFYIPPNGANGSGNYIEFDLVDINSTLKEATYYTPNGFDVIIGLNYSDTNSGIKYYQNTNLPGFLKIDKFNTTYTVTFEYTLTNGQLVVGQYSGPISN